jgi:dolichol-phosphate mannosyltransferase
MVSIILPTYNEAGNLPVLIPLISKYLRGIRHEMIVVDDNSPDGTAGIARKYREKGLPVRVIVRKNERGLASATLRGIRTSKYSIVAVMDTDLQHNPKYLPQLYRALESGADMAIGSRYINGGSFSGWPLSRKLISKTALLLTKPLTSVHDPLGQFYMVRKKILENIAFENIGCRLSLEILANGTYDRVVEVPIEFGNRTYGESKVLTLKSVLQDSKLLGLLYVAKIKRTVSGFFRLNLKGTRSMKSLNPEVKV